MTYTFKVGDRVKLNFPSDERYHNKLGTIVSFGKESSPWKQKILTVKMDDEKYFRYCLAIYSTSVIPLNVEEDDDLYI